MIALFKQKTPLNIVLLLILGILIKTPLFLHPHAIVATAEDGKLYHAIVSAIPVINGSNGLAAAVISFFLLYAQSLMVNYLVNEHRMTNKQTYLPALSYLLVSSLLPEWNYLSAPLITSTLIIWVFIKLFRQYNAPSAKEAVYNIGLLLGLGSFIFFPAVAFVICVLLGLLILRPFRFNEVVLLLFGALTPYYFFALYLFLNDRLTVQNLFPSIRFLIPKLDSSVWLAVAVSLLTLPFIIGSYHVQGQLRKMLIQVRKNWSILLFYLLFALSVPFVNSEGSFENWVLVVAPFSAFHACAYLYPQKKWLPLVLFFLTIAFIVLQQYLSPVWQ